MLAVLAESEVLSPPFSKPIVLKTNLLFMLQAKPTIKSGRSASVLMSVRFILLMVY
ncbi:hypothetical protein BN8_00210 [Fibrisoma limi BUZ 3]|uniref:Uncharacterized protein n=1 Tax=Fibrisoma limi BUZ 3 TaxID=1185876 RepID=I2GBL9_9BACT|nr:hypothetical protein BN8_00210 [Fibrisoma limi BUZ 3]